MAYIYHQASDPTERERIGLLQRYYDPKTIPKLQQLGVALGWNCLDVGAGGGSVAQWLAERVGPTGSVVAVDLEIDILAPLASRTLSVQRLDIRREDLPKNADLVHARLVLEHLRDYENDVLQRMIRALRPGGWLFLTDMDFRTMRWSDPDPAFDRVASAFMAATEAAGCNTRLGPDLASRFEKAGLTDVAAESWQTYERGGAIGSILARSYKRLHDQLIGYGARPADIDHVVAQIETAAVGVLAPTSWMTWGRRL